MVGADGGARHRQTAVVGRRAGVAGARGGLAARGVGHAVASEAAKGHFRFGLGFLDFD
jgi:hypothetical protein